MHEWNQTPIIAQATVLGSLMSLPKIAIEGISLVLLGSFNPAIFQPAWLAAHRLIPQEEADEAKIKLIHPELTEFSSDWLNLQVMHDRFTASTTQTAFFEPLRDFVIGTFMILEHTPVRMLGMNSDRHFELPSEEEWHQVGRNLAPPDPWEDVLNSPGLGKLMMQGVRPDDMKGAVNVTVEPSTRVKYGVYVNINDHFVIADDEDSVGSAGLATSLIRERWDTFLSQPETIAQAIFEVSK